MAAYFVVASRLGNTNGHEYWIGCWLNLEHAIAHAKSECEDRGGKYGVAVYEFEGSEHKLIHYSPSGYGEAEPSVNKNIELELLLGRRVVELLESKQPITAPILAEELNGSKRMVDAMYPGVAWP